MEFKLPDQQRLHSLSTLVTPRAGRVLAYWLIGIFTLIFFSLFLPWQQNINGDGRVTAFTPGDRPQTIETAIAGRIRTWNVREGQYVNKGDTIITLEEIKADYFDPDLLQRLEEQVEAKGQSIKATREKIEALESQIVALQQAREFKISQARNKLKQAKLKLQSDSADYAQQMVQNEVALGQFARYEQLIEQGLISLTDLEKRRLKLQEVQAKLVSSQNKVMVARNEVLNAKIQLSGIRADYADKIAKSRSDKGSALGYLATAQGELSKIRNKYANMVIRDQQYSLLAPQDGFIVKALKAGIGETIKEGGAVCTIMPDDPELAVALYVKAMDVPLISKGRKVRLEFDGWPALQFSGWPSVTVGTFGGVVTVIDYVDTKGKYRVLVTPDPDDPEKWPKQLRQGSGVAGWIMLDDVPVWYEIWRQLNGFPPTVDPEGEKEEKMGPDKKPKAPKVKI